MESSDDEEEDDDDDDEDDDDKDDDDDDDEEDDEEDEDYVNKEDDSSHSMEKSDLENSKDKNVSVISLKKKKAVAIVDSDSEHEENVELSHSIEKKKLGFESENEDEKDAIPDFSSLESPEPTSSAINVKKKGHENSVITLDSDNEELEEKASELSLEDQQQMRKELMDARLQIEKSTKLLKTTGGGVLLPDKGAKIKRSLEEAKENETRLKAILNVAQPLQQHKSGVFDDDEKKLDFLHKRVRLMKMQMNSSEFRNSPRGQTIENEIKAVQNQILKLTPMVMMKNPKYSAPKPTGEHGTPLKDLNRPHTGERNSAVHSVLCPYLKTGDLINHHLFSL